MSIQNSDGLFTFRVSSSDNGTYTVHNKIPAQTLRLKSVRVEFDTAAHALSTRVVYLDTPWLNSNHLIDGLANLYLLPIPIDNAICTVYTCDIPVQMSVDMNESFNYRIVDSSGAVPTGFASICLQFSYFSSFA